MNEANSTNTANQTDDARKKPAAPIADSADAIEMSFGDHLEELRGRLWKIVVAIFGVGIVCMFFYRDLWAIAMIPRARAAMYLGGDVEQIFPLQFLRPLEGFSCAFGLAIKIALALTLPLILRQTWIFVSPGLTGRERRALTIILSLGNILFWGGAVIAFFYTVPLGLRFLTDFDRTLPATLTQWRVDAYLDFVFMTCVGFGLGFELPLAMAALAFAGIISPDQIKHYWRHAVLALTVAGAVFTPPDPYTMVLLSGCLLLLYLAGYFLAKWLYPKVDDLAENAETKN